MADGMAILTEHWMAKIRLARKHKAGQFQDAADDAMKFYCGPYDFMYGAEYRQRSPYLMVRGLGEPHFKISVNKVAEMVDLYLPTLYHRNPNRMVSPRYCNLPPEMMLASLDEQTRQQLFMTSQQYGIPMPMLLFPGRMERNASRQMKARLMEYMLNQLASRNELKGESRNATIEALVKGRGLVWTILRASGRGIVPVSEYDSVDYLQVDPDSERLRDAGWIVRERFGPAWRLERDYGWPTGSIKGTHESHSNQALVASDPEGSNKRKAGETSDCITYYEVYSRIGIGGRLSGMPDEYREVLNSFADNCFLVLAEGVQHPINLPPWLFREDRVSREEFSRRIQWPVPFWRNQTHPWPCVELDLAPVPRRLWPMAHISKAMGELKAIQWISSFLVDKARNLARDFWISSDDIGSEIEDALQNGGAITHLKVKKSAGQDISDLLQFIKPPPINASFWQIVQYLHKAFEDRTGMTPLMYGQVGPTQPRSAQEVSIRNTNTQVRPEDMANLTEDWCSRVARNEAIAAAVGMGPGDVAPIYGERYDEAETELTMYGPLPPQMEPYTKLWLETFGHGDVEALVNDYDYHVESGSTRKPNRATEIDKANQAIATFGPIAIGHYQATGDPSLFNFLAEKFYSSNEWMDFQKGLLPDLRGQMAPPPQPGQGPPGGQPGQPPPRNGQPQQQAQPSPPSPQQNGAPQPAGAA